MARNDRADGRTDDGRTDDGRSGGRRSATLCVHGTGAPAEPGGAFAPPVEHGNVYRLTDEAYDERARGRADRSRVYGRETNPTIEALEERLAVLEGAERALAFSSGMAALHALLLAVLERGDEVVAFRELYGGTSKLLHRLLPRLGVGLTVVDVNDLDALAAAANERTRLLLCESIANPLTSVADLPAAREVLSSRSGRALLAVDATLATPIAQRPLELGADLVLHSATKFLAGHSDVVGGVLAGSDELLQEAWRWRTLAGGCLDPGAAYLLFRGLKTLAVRMRAHAEGARTVARFLAGHSRVDRVHFCGLEEDPCHPLAQRLLALPGGILSFVVAGGDDAARAVLRRLELVTEAGSLGGVESMANRPRDMSHADLSPEERAAAGIAPGLVRVSVGIEDPRDLVADLERALR